MIELTGSDSLLREYRIVIPRDELAAKYEARCARENRKLIRKGFRPGKAPVELVQRTGGARLMQETVSGAIDETVTGIIEAGALKPALRPKVDLVSDKTAVLSRSGDLEFKLRVDLLPPFDLIDLSGLRIERPVAEAGDNELRAELNRLARLHRKWDFVDAPAEHDDTVIIDFKAHLKSGAEFIGNRAADFSVVIGSGQMPDRFEDQLVGAAPGDHREIVATFPPDYRATELAGADVVFDTVVKRVRRPVVPAIDEAFAREVAGRGLTELVATLRDQIAKQMKSALSRRQRAIIADALIAAHRFRVPAGMIAAAARAEEPAPDTERRLRVQFIFDKIVAAYDLRVLPAEVTKAIAAKAETVVRDLESEGKPRNPVEIYRDMITDRSLHDEIRTEILTEKVFATVLSAAEVVDVPMTDPLTETWTR